jgi:hypothetical protein
MHFALFSLHVLLTQNPIFGGFSMRMFNFLLAFLMTAPLFGKDAEKGATVNIQQLNVTCNHSDLNCRLDRLEEQNRQLLGRFRNDCFKTATAK